MFFGVSWALSLVVSLATALLLGTLASVDKDYDYVNEARQCHYKTVTNDSFPYPYIYNEWSRYLKQGKRRTPPDLVDRRTANHLQLQVRGPIMQ
jgi:hypothetical protein